MRVNKWLAWLGVGLFPITMTGCLDKKEVESLKPAALVNGQVVAAVQVETELEKLGQVPPEQSPDIANRILGNVLDQELLAQEAVKSKLAEKDAVRMKIASARRQVLAETQIEAMTNNMAAPTKAEIQAYFDAHPELFATRRIYKLQELIVGTTPENITKVQELANQAKSPRELAAALQAQGIEVSVRQLVKAAEDLPAEFLAQLSGLKKGQSLTLSQGGKLNLVVLIDSEARPVSFSQASAVISRYLANAGKRRQVEAELVKLRQQAKIEYKPPYGPWAAKEPIQAKP